jgi:hypothetical protein
LLKQLHANAFDFLSTLKALNTSNTSVDQIPDTKKALMRATPDPSLASPSTSGLMMIDERAEDLGGTATIGRKLNAGGSGKFGTIDDANADIVKTETGSDTWRRGSSISIGAGSFTDVEGEEEREANDQAPQSRECRWKESSHESQRLSVTSSPTKSEHQFQHLQQQQQQQYPSQQVISDMMKLETCLMDMAQSFHHLKSLFAERDIKLADEMISVGLLGPKEASSSGAGADNASGLNAVVGGGAGGAGGGGAGGDGVFTIGVLGGFSALKRPRDEEVGFKQRRRKVSEGVSRFLLFVEVLRVLFVSFVSHFLASP